MLCGQTTVMVGRGAVFKIKTVLHSAEPTDVFSYPLKKVGHPGTVQPSGVGTVPVAACTVLLVANIVSGRHSFHKQSPEFSI